MKNVLSFLFALSLFTFLACGDDEVVPTTPQTIVGVASSNPDFSTLVAALSRVKLATVLEGAGPFTVFAPTNAAFTALGVDLATISDAALTEILLYHVIGAKISAADIAEGQTYAGTAAPGPGGNNLSVLIEKGSAGVKLNNIATVTTPDLAASNGVIHVVDAVLTPLNVVGHAAANKNFSALVGSLGAASGDLVNVLSGAGPFTVFAPLNSAFEEIATVAATLSADQLASILTYHVVSGNVRSTALTNGMEVATVNGQTFKVNLGESVTITDQSGGVATVVLTDVQGTNGVIHVLNKVLLPTN